MLRLISTAAILCLMNPATFAHEGHGLPTYEHGILHYAVNPAHFIPILLTAASGVGLWILVRRIRRATRDNRR